MDETFATLRDGRTVARDGNLGPPVDPALTTRVVEFNDLPALEAALAPGDVACVLAEPALTNVGIVHPEPGFHAALRDLTRRAGTLLIIDETHTICAGPGGYTRAHGLEPDMLTLGKPVAGGVPGAVYGFSEDVARADPGPEPARDRGYRRDRRHARGQRARHRRDARHARARADRGQLSSGRSRWPSGSRGAWRRSSPRSGCPGS